MEKEIIFKPAQIQDRKAPTIPFYITSFFQIIQNTRDRLSCGTGHIGDFL
jgi:hypothetical protein